MLSCVKGLGVEMCAKRNYVRGGKDLDCRVTFPQLLSNPASLPAHNYDIGRANRFFIQCCHSVIWNDLCMVVIVEFDNSNARGFNSIEFKDKSQILTES